MAFYDLLFTIPTEHGKRLPNIKPGVSLDGRQIACLSRVRPRRVQEHKIDIWKRLNERLHVCWVRLDQVDVGIAKSRVELEWQTFSFCLHAFVKERRTSPQLGSR